MEDDDPQELGKGEYSVEQQIQEVGKTAEEVEEDTETKVQTKSGASMLRVMVVLREVLQAFMAEYSTAARMTEQVAKQGRWMLQLPFRSRFERGETMRK